MTETPLPRSTAPAPRYSGQPAAGFDEAWLQTATVTARAPACAASPLPVTTVAGAASVDAGPQKLCLSAACLASLLDELDTGVVVCDPQGHALLVNEAARREMADGGVLHLTPDGLVDVLGGPDQQALRRAVHGAAWERRHQLLPLRVGGRLLLAGVQPLRGTPAHQPCALLLLGRRCLGADLAVHRLGGLYDLTDAEKAVLTSLLAGTRVGALARLRGVAVSTVRTQVAALRAKFGVRRVDDLTRLAAELPPMMSALRSPLARAMRGDPPAQPLA